MTMTKLTPGRDASATFALPDATEQATAQWRMLDEADEVIVSWTPATISEKKAVIALAAENLALTAPALRGLRRVVLEVTEPGQPATTQEQVYLLAGDTALAIGVNSFLTYGQAQLAAMDFSGDYIDGWSENTEQDARESALIEAFERICRLPIVVEYDDSQSIVREITNQPPRLRDFTAEQMKNLDAKMLRALRKAQVVEAAEILRADPMLRARVDGLVSRTVGESSEFFGASKAMSLGVGTRAASLLTRWLRYSTRIARA